MANNFALMSWLLVVMVAWRSCSGATATIDCRRPPKITLNPMLCCVNTGVEVTPQCIERLEINGQMPLGDKALTRLTECVLTEAHFTPKWNAPPDMTVIRSVLLSLYANDAIYVEALLESLRKCRSIVKRNLLQFQKLWRHQVALHQYKLVARTPLGCSGQESGSSCSAHSGTENANCAQAKQFLRQCVWQE